MSTSTDGRRSSSSPSVPTATQEQRAFAEILHELIRPDNGKCNQCGAEWFYRLDGSWEYVEGEHFPHCIARRVIERRTGDAIRLSAFVAELHANAPAASSEEAANSDTDQTAGEIIVNRDEWYAAKKDAERWRAIRPTLSVDGDYTDGSGDSACPHVQWLTVDEEKVHRLATSEGWTHTVESLIDAARVQGENSQ